MFNNRRIAEAEAKIDSIDNDVDELEHENTKLHDRIEELEVNLEAYRLASLAVAETVAILFDLSASLAARINKLEDERAFRRLHSRYTD